MSGPALRTAFDYLEGLAQGHRKKLYEQPSTALAIFRRMLPHLAKTFVMMMLWMTDPLPMRDLDSWVQPRGQREKDQALNLLERMNILSRIQDPGHPLSWQLAKPFVVSLRHALTGGGNHRSFGVAATIADTSEKETVTIDTLDDYARTQWESILYFVVGSAESGLDSESIDPAVRQLLMEGNFVTLRGQEAQITQGGFNFLLQDVNTQVWTLLIVYLEQAEKLHMEPVEMLSFLFTLGSLDHGQAYSTTDLTPTQQRVLEDLNALGIVYTTSPDSKQFYPTRLATTLNSDSNALGAESLAVGGVKDDKATNVAVKGSSDTAAINDRGYIVVETNYRVFAYTDSTLRIAILSLFTKLNTKFPNMIMGKLTRESVRSAVERGITADQIISYLQTHAHPIMVQHSIDSKREEQQAQQASGAIGDRREAVQHRPILPPTVSDQVRLWQIEGDRMRTTAGFLFQDLRSVQEYEQCVQLADTIGVLVWKDDKMRRFFVTRMEQIRDILTKKNDSSGGGATHARKTANGTATSTGKARS